MKPPLALVIALNCALTVTAADETYTVKKWPTVPAEGKSLRLEGNAEFSMTTKVKDEDGKLVKDKKQENRKREVYTEKTLEMGKGKDGKKQRQKFLRAYSKSEEGQGKGVKKEPYEGRTIVFERVEGKYKAKAEGEPALDPKVLEALEAEENKDSPGNESLLMPKGPVKVGEKWKVAGKDIAKVLDMFKPDPEKSSGEGKLVKVFKKGDKQFGRFEFTLTTLTKTDDLDIRGSAVLTVERAIDGSTPAGKLTMKLTTIQAGTVEQQGKKYAFERKSTLHVQTNEEDTADK